MNDEQKFNKMLEVSQINLKEFKDFAKNGQVKKLFDIHNNYFKFLLKDKAKTTSFQYSFNHVKRYIRDYTDITYYKLGRLHPKAPKGKSRFFGFGNRAIISIDYKKFALKLIYNNLPNKYAIIFKTKLTSLLDYKELQKFKINRVIDSNRDKNGKIEYFSAISKKLFLKIKRVKSNKGNFPSESQFQRELKKICLRFNIIGIDVKSLRILGRKIHYTSIRENIPNCDNNLLNQVLEKMLGHSNISAEYKPETKELDVFLDYFDKYLTNNFNFL